MRAAIDSALPSTAVISRSTYVSDGGGDGSVSWGPVGTVSCRLTPAGVASSEREIASRIASDANWTVTFPALTDVTPADRVTIASVSYEVTAVKHNGAEWELSRRAELNEIV